MTNTSYHIIRKALIDQRNRVAHSPQEATKLIDDLGIRHILITDEDGDVTSRPSVTKAAPKKKLAAKKVAAKKGAAK
jgi:hypothetical protein